MIAELKPYPAYKDSGVEWLGEVPEHWEVRKLRQVLRAVTGRNRPELPLLSVVREKGVILRDVSSKDENHNFIPDDLTNYKVVQQDQFAINKMKAWQGSYGVSKFDGIVSPAYFVFSIDGVDSYYFHMAIRSKAYVPYFTRASDGVRIGQWDLSLPRMREVPLSVPPLPEQTAIARYLDYTDRRIQRYIRAKQKLITLLQEQKQAIIHQAVTGQIDVRTGQPYPAYKDSGVEWLGEVPEHWGVRKLRRCVTVSGGMTPSMEVRRFWDGPIPWVTPKDMKRAVISDSSVRVTDSAIQETPLRLIEPPAVLIVVRGMILARRVPIASTTAPVTINQDMKALRTVEGTKAAFLACLLDSAQEAFMPLIDEAGHGTRRLPMERWREIVIAIPPEEEQATIVEHLDNRTAAIDTTISRTQRQIDLLSEYRTRLISDVVTGKLDVREVAARLPEVDPLETEADSGEPLGTDVESNLDELGTEVKEAVT
ncbi:MAG: restriction endonuclease subunit S [Truepera sp.]|nr:restriction endonuclease subunit S [Truepera sp.]